MAYNFFVSRLCAVNGRRVIDRYCVVQMRVLLDLYFRWVFLQLIIIIIFIY